MRVVTFNPNEHNFIIIGQDSYFILQTDEGENLLSRNRCSHKGGPLHLGRWDCIRQQLVCPWHEQAYAKKHLQKTALPSIFRSDRVTAVIDESGDGCFDLYRTTVLANYS